MTCTHRPYLLCTRHLRKNILFAGATLLIAAPAHAEDYNWRACMFNGTSDPCDLAGSRYSATLTFRKDGKRIRVEKVGADYPCGDGSADECGKALITETNGRSTWASYRFASDSSTWSLRSTRGNIYVIPYN